MKKLLISSCSLLMLTSMVHSNTEKFNDKDIDFMIEQAEFSGVLDDRSQSTKAGTTYVTVGNDNNCDYRAGGAKIQSAILGVSYGTEIRIAHGTYEENLYIDSKSVKLLGGYADCTAADNDDYSVTSTSTKIIPVTGSGLPVIRVTGDSARHNLTLRNLTIQNGESTSSSYSGGGVAFYNADYNVTIQKADINYNNGKFGGGISVRFGKTNIGLIGSNIWGNNAEYGGGIHCNGSNNSLYMDNTAWYMFGFNERMLVFANTATYDGGGAQVTQGCQFTSYVGGSLLDGGFYLNKANRHGGGIDASFGAKIDLFGDLKCSDFPFVICNGNNNHPNTFYDNQADNDNNNDGDGGAVYATGSNTKVTATNVNFTLNDAYRGGAVFVTDEAEFETYAVNYQNCWEKGRCNQFTHNTASTNNGHGGAFYALDGGRLRVITSHIEGNRADYGSAFYINGTNSSVYLSNSYVVDNGDSGTSNHSNLYPVRVWTDGSATLHFNTIADNNIPASSASVANSAGITSLFGNIIHDESGASALLTSSPAFASEHYNIVNDFGNMITTTTNVEDDPMFIDRANNDYHIDASLSPAVDYSSHYSIHQGTQDTDGDLRGWDDYTVGNIYGRFDAGADETYDNDIIFKDGFE